jgi:hypothetical protein
VELHLIEDPEFEPSPFEREFGRHVAVSVPLEEFAALQGRLPAHGAVLIDPCARRPTGGSSSATRTDMFSKSSRRITTSHDP